jgi:serine/threonine protein kinase
VREGRPWSRSEFLARNAEISAALSGCFSGLEFVEAAVAELPGSEDESAQVLAEPALPPLSRLGDYHIVREVGRGGMGIVYEAQQLSLDRRVALKVLPFAASIDPKQRQRFQIEAQAAAQLHHAHIVPVFGVGCDNGMHYYAMQFVDGRSLAAIIRDLRSGGAPTPSWAEPLPSRPSSEHDDAPVAPPEIPNGVQSPTSTVEYRNGISEADPGPSDNSKRASRSSKNDRPPTSGATARAHEDRVFCRKVARLGVEAADALEHAHALGVVHRDIKPANLLIDRNGAVWITDFGLARFAGDQSITGTGDVVGTLRYMSPEQALARRGVVDQRTDIYSLGATIYELLALRPAFDGRDHQELLRQIAQDEPVPPRRLNSAVPHDLETIVLKAMSKDPSGRYATAQELSEDLKRFLNDDPIMGRRPGLIERTSRWARRRWELVATAAAILMLSLAIGAGVTWRQARAIAHQARAAEEARNKYRDYIIRHFALLDRSAENQVNEASTLVANAPGDPAARAQAFQTYDQILNLFQEASELPPTDIESRIVTARALCRLAYTRTMLAFQKGKQNGPEPKLMAAAGSDFRQSIELFEKLLGEDSSATTIRRYMADAVGLKGMGCYLRFTNRPQEAERLYGRAIDLRRDLIMGKNADGTGVPPRISSLAEREDVMLLVYTAEIVASMTEGDGQVAEAERIRRQLEDDVLAIAARYSGPMFEGQRRQWASELAKMQSGSANPSARRIAVLNARLALALDPENSNAHNNLAWALASVVDDPWFDPKDALASARKAVELEPKRWEFWNTLGVAAFRNSDWPTARDALQKSIDVSGGKAHDWFFMAMTRWNQGKRDEARQTFKLALAALKNESPEDPELRRFHKEAADLMGLPAPKTESPPPR